MKIMQPSRKNKNAVRLANLSPKDFIVIGAKGTTFKGLLTHLGGTKYKLHGPHISTGSVYFDESWVDEVYEANDCYIVSLKNPADKENS